MSDAVNKRKSAVTFDEPGYRSLKEAQAVDGIPTSHRVRALVQLWSSDAEIRERADHLAQDLLNADNDLRYNRRLA